ncbi:MAG: ROK family protein [Alphaproteobacteria bacterium]|nr:ROK family protein [Alphaproteobacteria bacterium]
MSSKPLLVIDIGGTHLKFGAIHGDETRVLGQHFPTSSLRNEDPIGSLAALIRQASLALNIEPAAVVSTIPGFLDPDHDLVHFAGNIPQFRNVRVASALTARLGLPVVLERDSVMCLQGEWLSGAARGANHLLGLFFGTGVGGAFLQNGQPFRGAGYALEIGNMPFKGEGRKHENMRDDCLEAYVSGRALLGIATRHGVPITEVFALQDSTPVLAKEITKFLLDFSIAIGIGVALFSPDTILLGGGICEMKGFPREQMASMVEANAPFEEMGKKLDLRWAALGWEAVLIGARQAAAAAGIGI